MNIVGEELGMSDLGHVLVVDDDPDTREILDLVLGTLEIPIHQACNGYEALQCVAKESPRLILLDLSMPELDGQIVLEALRVDVATASIPVIVFTASVVTPELVKRLGISETRVIRKGNLSMTYLRDLVGGILGYPVSLDI